MGALRSLFSPRHTCQRTGESGKGCVVVTALVVSGTFLCSRHTHFLSKGKGSHMSFELWEEEELAGP